MGGLSVTGDGPTPRNQGGVSGVGSSGPGGGPCVGAAVQAKRDVGLAVSDE